DVGKRPRGYKKHFPLKEDSTPSFLILLAYSHSSAICIAEKRLCSTDGGTSQLGVYRDNLITWAKNYLSDGNY
ncbi:MAG: hypothetical protein EVA80_03450, partial [Proteobacteria bacterium]